MGYEYRLHVDPPVTELDAVCEAIFATTRWEAVETSFVGKHGIGVKCADTPIDPRWPHLADLHLEDTGTVFVVCHSQNGRRFMEALVRFLRKTGHRVSIDEDV